MIYFPPETAGGLKKSDQTVMSEKRVLRAIERVKVGEDTQYHYTSKFPILKNGEPYFIAGIAIDITEKILAEEEKKNLEANIDLHSLSRHGDCYTLRNRWKVVYIAGEQGESLETSCRVCNAGVRVLVTKTRGAEVCALERDFY